MTSPTPAPTPRDCEHDWVMPTLTLGTDICEKKPVVCSRCGKRRAWRKGEHYVSAPAAPTPSEPRDAKPFEYGEGAGSPGEGNDYADAFPERVAAYRQQKNELESAVTLLINAALENARQRDGSRYAARIDAAIATTRAAMRRGDL